MSNGSVLSGGIWWPHDAVPTAEQQEAGAMLRRRRKEMGLTMRELGALLNVPRQKIDRWEAGQEVPNDMRAALNEALTPPSKGDAA